VGTEWGPALPGTLAFTTRRSAVLTVAGVERRFTAGGMRSVLDRVVDVVLGTVALPRLRPVVVQVSGAPRGPVRIEVLPSGSVSFAYADDVDG
jgi:hypothetical protein